MRRSIRLAAGLAALAAASGGALQLADGSHAERPAERKPVTMGDSPVLMQSSAAMSSADFDPVVNDVLEDSGDIAGLVDDVLADVPEQPAPSAGGATPGDVSGGSGTDDILGFINRGGENIAGITNDVLAGKELTPEQREICEFLIRKGPSIEAWDDIMAVNGQIDVDLANAHLRELYPLGFRDSYGNFWKPDHETGRWTRVTEDGRGGSPRFNPGPLAPPPSFPNEPPSSPGGNSGSIDNIEPKPRLLANPPLSLLD